jgi:hypothetical protein
MSAAVFLFERDEWGYTGDNLIIYNSRNFCELLDDLKKSNGRISTTVEIFMSS